MDFHDPLIPAKAGTQDGSDPSQQLWAPAFAGVSGGF